MQPGLFVPVMRDRGKPGGGGWLWMLWFSQVGKRSMHPGAVNTEDIRDSCRAVARKTSLEYVKLIPCFLYSL